jgi:TfoX/Sxy family transcriptional regulator of competence genes
VLEPSQDRRVNAATAFLGAVERLSTDINTITTRKMFGQPCAFLNNNMFLYTYADELVLRLSAEDRPKLEGGKPFAPKGGRGMREYVVLPAALLEDAVALETWIARGAQYAATLDPRAARPRAKKSQSVKVGS